jgi:hypothetical protein
MGSRCPDVAGLAVVVVHERDDLAAREQGELLGDHPGRHAEQGLLATDRRRPLRVPGPRRQVHG